MTQQDQAARQASWAFRTEGALVFPQSIGGDKKNEALDKLRERVESHQPGDTWERGLVPRELQKPLSLAEPDLPLPVSPPLSDLGQPFSAPQLLSGKNSEFYVERFLQRFGAGIGRGVVHRDKAGQALVVSDQLFRNLDGAWTATKFEAMGSVPLSTSNANARKRPQ